ncbi:MFS-type transporter SLC18B1 [Caerostris darwini]|uniref:MFS-type transporter SLC18B1 n=1 Tax=Caerostris darwini TaxID=1538125 RepID=A0AAV4USK6_9ARAC|nr:MFS-type transporter SLC18B1 [Caerostris darwini]
MLLVISKNLLLLLSLWTGIFCNYACYSIIAPFFPQLARQKGLSAEQYSFVFGVYSLSQITFSIIVGRSLTKVGAKFIVLAGLFLTGGSTILFGCLEKSPGGPIFFWLCMAVRAVEGAGFAAYLTSSLAVIVRTFPTNPGYYVGLTETIVTVAMISGPPLGSALYTAGGYICPFVSFGSVIIIMSIASYYLISENKGDPNDKQTDPGSLSLKEYHGILKLPAGAMVLVSVTCNVTADAFILIALSEHLVQFHLTPMMVGSIYLCLFLSYGLSSPLAGKIGDKMGGEFLLQSGGCLIMAISFILIGPGSFLNMKPKIVLIVVGLLLKGLGAGPLISCSYSAALKAARKSGLPEDFRTYSLVSTLVSFSIPLGNLVGGVTTGIMTENLGMKVSTTVYGGIFLLLAIICLIVHFYEPYLHKKTQELKWIRMKQNLLQGEEMPLVNKIKNTDKIQENGRILSQNAGFGSIDNHCCVPLEHTNLEETVIGCENNPKLQWLDDPTQAKNFWLT